MIRVKTKVIVKIKSVGLCWVNIKLDEVIVKVKLAACKDQLGLGLT